PPINWTDFSKRFATDSWLSWSAVRQREAGSLGLSRLYKADAALSGLDKSTAPGTDGGLTVDQDIPSVHFCIGVMNPMAPCLRLQLYQCMYRSMCCFAS